MKTKNLCTLGLLIFVASYVLFSQGPLSAPHYLDWAHWLNLIGAVLLFSFTRVFPKNRLSSIAAFLTILGVIAHIGLCTIDFIMWSFSDNVAQRNKLWEHLLNTPQISYPFITIGPSLLFVGLATYALSFIKTNTISALMVLLGGPFVGLSYFVWNDGNLMLLSCIIFTCGLGTLLHKVDMQSTIGKIIKKPITFNK